jgi:transcription initiation factor TFIIIB Brf1 subunit/transcription initiation factor TFIIB
MDDEVKKWFEEELAKYKELHAKPETKKIREMVDEACKKLDLPIADQAYELLINLRERGFVTGVMTEIAVGAAIYLAGKAANQPVIIKEIADALKVNKDRLARAIRRAIAEYGVKNPVLRPEVFVGRIVKKLGLPEKVAQDAKDMLKDFTVPEGKRPEPFAAAAVYLAAHGLGIRREDVIKAVYSNATSLQEALKLLRLALKA